MVSPHVQHAEQVTTNLIDKPVKCANFIWFVYKVGAQQTVAVMAAPLRRRVKLAL